MIQGEYMFAQGGRAPGLRGVAVIALQPKDTRMDCRFWVALGAFRWCASIFTIGVAICTLYYGMLSIEREEIGVLEVTQTVDAIMAYQARTTELGDVFAHEGRIMKVMAIQTGLQVVSFQAIRMAGGTGDRLLGIIGLVQYQAESSRLQMREWLTLQGCR